MCVYRNELKEKNDRKQRVKNVFTLVVCLFFFFFLRFVILSHVRKVCSFRRAYKKQKERVESRKRMARYKDSNASLIGARPIRRGERITNAIIFVFVKVVAPIKNTLCNRRKRKNDGVSIGGGGALALPTLYALR